MGLLCQRVTLRPSWCDLQKLRGTLRTLPQRDRRNKAPSHLTASNSPSKHNPFYKPSSQLIGKSAISWSPWSVPGDVLQPLLAFEPKPMVTTTPSAHLSPAGDGLAQKPGDRASSRGDTAVLWHTPPSHFPCLQPDILLPMPPDSLKRWHCTRQGRKGETWNLPYVRGTVKVFK